MYHQEPKLTKHQTKAGLQTCSDFQEPTWIPPGHEINIAGRRITGMVYVGQTKTDDIWSQHGGTFIDPQLPVHPTMSDIGGRQLEFYPHYSHINLPSRTAYLDWLATGRSDTSYNLGYLFLYFYGLERRLICDNPAPQERRLLVREVERLLALHPENAAVDHYLPQLLTAVDLLYDGSSNRPARYRRTGQYALPYDIQFHIGASAQERTPIHPDWLLSWYIAHPEYSVTTHVTRALPEFRALFQHLLKEQYPHGVIATPGKPRWKPCYDAASKAFQQDISDLTGTLPDIHRMRRPLRAAHQIFTQTQEGLNRYNRLLGRDPQARGSLQAHALLPHPARSAFPCPELEELAQWAQQAYGDPWTSAMEIVRKTGNPSHDGKITRAIWDQAQQALAATGYRIAPSHTLRARVPLPQETALIYPHPEAQLTNPDPHTEDQYYAGQLANIAVITHVFHADRSPGAAACLHNPGDQQPPREYQPDLLANAQWCISNPLDTRSLYRILRRQPPSAQETLAGAAVLAARVGSPVTPAAVKAVEQVYTALNLPKQRVYSDLNDSTIQQSQPGPVTLRPEHPGPPETPLPSEQPTQSAPVHLDEQRVAAIMEETKEISAILGQVFQDDPADTQYHRDTQTQQQTHQGQPEAHPSNTNPWQDTTPKTPQGPADQQEQAGTSPLLPGLDPQHIALLLELQRRGTCASQEASQLAAQQGLMLLGAIETINDAALEHLDDILLLEDDQGDITLNPDLPINTETRQELHP